MDYRFLVRNTGKDEPQVAFTIDKLSDVFEDPAGRPRANIDLINMDWQSKGEVLPITNNDEAALDVFKDLVEISFSEYAEKFSANYLAFKDAEVKAMPNNAFARVNSA